VLDEVFLALLSSCPRSCCADRRAQEQEIQSVLAHTESSENQSDSNNTSPQGFNYFGLLSSHPSTLSLDRTEWLHPTISQAMELWQKYLQNVEPVTRILHVPTAQLAVFTGMNDPYKSNPDINSLLFAVYFSTLISLEPVEVKRLLGQDKATAMGRFKLGLEKSLVESNFCERPKLMTLEALALFLVRNPIRIRGMVLLPYTDNDLRRQLGPITPADQHG
jgi:hypothetical protein